MRRLKVAVALLVGASLVLPAAAQAAKPKRQGKQKSEVVRVMTRNLFLGADLTPAITAPSIDTFVDANGGILRQVTATNFPVRARGLAKEILQKKPDLVGLQEVALWRTAAPSLNPVIAGPSATTVRYDFLELLLAQLNKGKKRYRVAIVQDEFDFEAPANENGQPGDGSGLTPNAEINGRLTMRDVILVRRKAGVTATNPISGNFVNPLVVTVSGLPVTVRRGWTALDAKVRGGKRFRFVNTHLEAFDDRTQHPSIRALQAGELVASGGPATGKAPVVLLGDLNSDDDTVVADDQQAYRALLDAGFVSRSTNKPLSCCVNSFDLKTGSVAEFDHQVDHVMTNRPGKVKLVNSSVTGRKMQNGYWDSDHAGVFSTLRIR